MFLKNSSNGDMVEVLDVAALTDPCRDSVAGRFHAGEELQDPETFVKAGLAFPSGEQLPRCWVDAAYRA